MTDTTMAREAHEEGEAEPLRELVRRLQGLVPSSELKGGQVVEKIGGVASNDPCAFPPN